LIVFSAVGPIHSPEVYSKNKATAAYRRFCIAGGVSNNVLSDKSFLVIGKSTTSHEEFTFANPPGWYYRQSGHPSLAAAVTSGMLWGFTSSLKSLEVYGGDQPFNSTFI
jgi:hypothetical protein